MREAIGNKPLYHPKFPSWWMSARQRLVLLEFPTIEDAERWDENPALEDLISS